MPYVAPLRDTCFLLDHVVGADMLAGTDRFAEAGADLRDAVLAEAGRVATEVLAPLNRAGDIHPAWLDNGVVRTPPGFAEGYRALSEGGWISVAAPPAHGGMGLPVTLQTAINDFASGACLALQTCPLLVQGQIEALAAHAEPALQATYLPKLISGAWSATMNLTEPQAGTDVGALTTRAEPAGDGTYRITGSKIYITYGDSDLVENVVHLVLARLPDAPPGTKGISLFLVPKRLPDADGRPGAANALRVVRLEHKMGLHGSPTCEMAYEGATGWRVGAEHGGMAAMFTMMNNARLAVGVQGVGVAEAATQAALAHARERRQGPAPRSGTIVEHADVRRMLATMRAEVFATRAIALATGVAIDMATATGEAGWAARAALLTPIVKAWGTEVGHAAAQTGIQVHGGIGYVEETGVAQYARDIRVAAIYEGTNGIQAMDLVGRKMADGGAEMHRLLGEIRAGAEAARPALPGLAAAVHAAAGELADATDWLVAQGAEDRFAGAVPYLHAAARLLGAHHHLRAARVAGGARAALAAVYIQRCLPMNAGDLAHLRAGAEGLFALSADELAT